MKFGKNTISKTKTKILYQNNTTYRPSIFIISVRFMTIIVHVIKLTLLIADHVTCGQSECMIKCHMIEH